MNDKMNKIKNEATVLENEIATYEAMIKIREEKLKKLGIKELKFILFCS